MMAWIHFPETNLPHCFTLKTSCGIFIQKPKILQVPYMLLSSTFFPLLFKRHRSWPMHSFPAVPWFSAVSGKELSLLDFFECSADKGMHM